MPETVENEVPLDLSKTKNVKIGGINSLPSDRNKNSRTKPPTSSSSPSEKEFDAIAEDTLCTPKDDIARVMRDDSLCNSHVCQDGRQDTNVKVFQKPPQVEVTGAKLEESWPAKHIVYDVKLTYNGFSWKIVLSKRKLTALWFYVKGQENFLTTRILGTSAAFAADRTHDAFSTISSKLRKFFVANAEKSINPENVALIQEYLKFVLNDPYLLSTTYVLGLLQVSASTFDDGGAYTSLKEGWLKVRIWLKGTNEDNVQISRGNVVWDNPCFNCFCVVKKVNLKSKRWRWVALKRSCIAFYKTIQDTQPSEVVLFDSKFSVERGVRHVGSATGMVVTNSTYVVHLEGKHKSSITKWANSIRKAVEESPWSELHRDGSFAIPRYPNELPSRAKWFVDGKDAYNAMYYALLNAQKEIFIAGWWICPSIYLLRPPDKYPESRLDVLLKKKAEAGVKIYVLMYKEVSVALTLNSLYSKLSLRKLHPNICVLRDPDFIYKQLGMWSHHEKIVSVDQKVSFVGGLDICFGRWDTHNHELYDNESQTFKGKDYSNPRIKDFVEVDKPDDDLMNRLLNPRMPWHDCHSRLEGQAARDVARHFIQRWNYSIFTRGKHHKMHQIVPRLDYDKNSKYVFSFPNQPSLNSLSAINRFKKAASTVSTIKKIASNFGSHQSERGFNRMSSVAAIHQTLDERHSDAEIDDRLPWDETDSLVLEENHRSPVSSIENEFGMYSSPDEVSNSHDSNNKGFPCVCHIVRSISKWSGGCSTEASIQNAYIRLINESKNFIYIENQFFISGQDGDTLCHNRIANAIVNRILRAVAANKPFKVIVMMPLLPAFPGKVEEKEAYSLRGVMHWQYRSICRGGNSIYERLYKVVEDPFEYIAFFGLRTHSVDSDNKPQTEEVYIHSKLMIVDDMKTIIGSANINERSMNGDRDSEIAVVIEDTDVVTASSATLGGERVGLFGHSFRMKLFEEHFGLEEGTSTYNKFRDPVDSNTWFDLQDQAMKNYSIYELVFGCLPSDEILSFKELPGINNKTSSIPHSKSIGSMMTDNLNVSAEKLKRSDNDGTSITKGGPDSIDEHDVELDVQSASSGEDLPPSDSKFVGGIFAHLHDSVSIDAHRGELKEIRGHVVYFPLRFLANEELEPKLYPADLFQ